MTKPADRRSKLSEMDSRIDRRLRAAASFISALIKGSADGKSCVEQFLKDLSDCYSSNNLVASEPTSNVGINYDNPPFSSVRSFKRAWLNWHLIVQQANLNNSQRAEAVQAMLRVLLPLREKTMLPSSLIRFEALQTLEWMWLEEDRRWDAALAEAQRSPEYQKLVAEKVSAPDPVEVSRRMLLWQARISAV